MSGGGIGDVARLPRRAISNAVYLPQQHSFSSSEEELRSTAEYDGEYTRAICVLIVQL